MRLGKLHVAEHVGKTHVKKRQRVFFFTRGSEIFSGLFSAFFFRLEGAMLKRPAMDSTEKGGIEIRVHSSGLLPKNKNCPQDISISIFYRSSAIIHRKPRDPEQSGSCSTRGATSMLFYPRFFTFIAL